MKIKGVEMTSLLAIGATPSDVMCDMCGASVRAFEKIYAVAEHGYRDKDGYGRSFAICEKCGKREVDEWIAKTVTAHIGKGVDLK